MEGTQHTERPMPPAEPKPIPSRPQPTTARKTGNKRAKSSPLDHATPKLTAVLKPSEPIEYELVGMLVGRERFPHDLERIQVTLSIPSPDDECPIALEAISTAELAFLPGCPFIQDMPEHTKMTLPCGHSFSAMVIVYSWCKSSMICPCCRRGVQRRANVNYLPSHFRQQLKAQIASSLNAERIDEERDSITAIMNMTPITMSFADLANEECLEMTVGFYFRPADEEPRPNSHFLNPPGQRPTASRGHFSMMVRLTAILERRGDRPHVAVFRPSEQNMSVLRRSPSDIRSISVTTQMRIANAGVVEIDSSGQIDFPDPLPAGAAAQTLSHTPLILRRATGYRQAQTSPEQARNLPVIPVSTFELAFGQNERYVFLDNVTWIPDSSHVHVSLARPGEA